MFDVPTASMVNSPEASISKVVESISIGLSALVPIAILVAESIVNAPVASISRVEALISTATFAAVPILIPLAPSSDNAAPALTSIAPCLDVRSISPSSDATFRPSDPDNVNIPWVVIFDVPTASTVTTPEALTSNAAESMVTGTSASVPILIAVDPSRLKLPAFASISTAPSATTVKSADVPA